MKRVFRYIFRSVVVVILLVFLIFSLLYVPLFQRLITDKAVSIVSEKTGWQIVASPLRLSFPLKLELGDITAVSQPNHDTIFHLGSFQTQVAFFSLLKGEVKIGSVNLNSFQSNMTGMIKGLDLKGHIHQFRIDDIYVNLLNHTGEVNSVLLSDADIRMHFFESEKDTVTEESAPLKWKFKIGNVRLDHARYALDLEQSGINLDCGITKGALDNAFLSLDDNTYQVEKISLKKSFYSMDLDTLPGKKGQFDFKHYNFQNINIDVDSVYNQQQIVKAIIHSASFEEQSGFNLLSLQGRYQMNSLSIQVDGLRLKTRDSHISMDAKTEMSVFDSIPTGSLNLMLDASLSKKDLALFVSPFFPDFASLYPDYPLLLKSDVKGDMNRLDISVLDMNLYSSFDLEVDGYLQALSDNKKTSGKISLDGIFQNLDFVESLLSDSTLRKQISIPHDMTLDGSLFANAGEYVGNLTLQEQKSQFQAKATFIPSIQKYNFDIISDQIDLKRFLPMSSFGKLDMKIQAFGQGFDPMSRNTSTQFNATIAHFEISPYQIHNLTLNGELNRSIYHVSLAGNDSLFDGSMNIDGRLTKDDIRAQIDAELKKLDLYHLKLVDENYAIGGSILATAQTNYKNQYYLDAQVKDMSLLNKGKLSEYGDLNLLANVTVDSMRLSAVNGDLSLNAEIEAGLDSLLQRSKHITENLEEQIKQRRLNLISVQKMLPQMVVQLNTGRQNALYSFLNSMGIGYNTIDLLLNNDKEQGIRIIGQTSQFRKDTLLLSNVDLSMIQHKEKIDIEAIVESKNRIPGDAYTIVAKGEILPEEVSVHFLQKNGLQKILFDVGAQVNTDTDEIKLQIIPYQPTLLGRNWQVNNDNYIALTKTNNIRADFILTGEKGMELSVLTNDTLSEEGITNLKVGINKFNLANLSDYLVDYPPFSGMVNGDFDVNLNDKQIDAKGRVRLDTIMYNRRLLGDIVLDMNYETSPEIGHWGYASVLLENNKIMECDLNYNSSDSTSLSANASLYDLPLNLADPFIPDAMLAFDGSVSGEIHFTGDMNKPVLNAHIDNKNAGFTFNYANATYKLDQQPIIIHNSILPFNNYQIFAYNKNPLIVNGNVNFQDLNRIMTDLRLSGNDVELINAKKQKHQMVYGRMLMSINTTVTGPMNFLKIRGNINLLGGTNINYVMLDSPVAAQNRVANLVTFTSFNNDTIASENPKLAQKVNISGMDILLTFNINQTVQMGIDLSANGDDRVELNGGGDLAFRMNSMGETDMSGRYNLTGGFVRYNLPILPVGKTFSIQNGSYVDWSGQLMNPYINIIAAENIRTSITEESKGSRIVNFQALILIQNRLDNLSVIFDVKAPDDPSIQNQLAQMTEEERSKQAMNLIITQTYTGPGTTSKMSSNSALTAFISKEINQFAGSALKGVDVNVGIDMYDQNDVTGDASKRTDYSFRFSKKLFNDRFRIVVGGKVSSGQEPSKEQESFIQDVTLEYMLDKSGSRYIRLFHHTGYESVFEGEIVETGLGIVLQRKVRRLKQLFIFDEKRRNRAIYSQPKESQNEK